MSACAKPLPFFDANVRIGRPRIAAPGAIFEPDDVRAALRRLGVADALVVHHTAVEHDPATGNRQCLRAAGGRPRLWPSCVLVPHHAGSMAHARTLVPRAVRRGVRAVRLYPKRHGFVLNELTCGAVFDALETWRVPLVLDLAETTWPDVQQLAASRPDLRLVLANGGYRVHRFLFPLLACCPNVYFEISQCHSHGFLEHVAARLGVDRILFGSRLPVLDVGPACAMVTYADLSESQKRLVAGDNLRRLLAEVEVPG